MFFAPTVTHKSLTQIQAHARPFRITQMSSSALLIGSPGGIRLASRDKGCRLRPSRDTTSAAARHRRRRHRLGATVTAGAAPSLPAEEAKVLLERDGYRMLDVRSWKAYDREHLTKPPQCTANVPLADDEDPAAAGGFVANVQEQGFRPGAKLLVADADGSRAQAAADALCDAGYTAVIAVQGGYDGWRAIFTTW